jgi:hypothetical protein
MNGKLLDERMAQQMVLLKRLTLYYAISPVIFEFKSLQQLCLVHVTNILNKPLMSINTLSLYRSTTFQHSILQMTNLINLILEGQSSIHDDTIKNMTYLKYLSMSYVHGFSITDDTLANLVGLTSLNLDANTKITSLSLSKLINLKSLCLKNINSVDLNQILHLPLINLDMQYWHTVPDLSSLTNLRRLNISHCIFVADISNLKLETLAIRNNVSIKNLPTSLRCLDLSYNNMVTSRDLVKCMNLERLMLCNDNKHIHVNYINQLTNLQYLNLYSNRYIKDGRLSTQLRRITVRDLDESDLTFKMIDPIF